MTMPGIDEPLNWQMDEHDGLVIELLGRLQSEGKRPCKQAYAFRIEGVSNVPKAGD